MNTRLFLVCGFLLLLALAYLLVGPDVEPLPQTALSPPTPESSEDVLKASSHRTSIEPPKRQAQQGKPTDSELVQATTRRVLVLNKQTRQPVSGAKVRVVDHDRLMQAINQHRPRLQREERGALADEIASHAVTGVDGIAAPLFAGRRQLVDAELGSGLWARRLVTDMLEDPVVLLLEVDHELRAQVIDGYGKARAGVAVALRRLANEFGTYSVGVAESRGDKGIAVFAHVQRRLKKDRGWQLAFAFPLLEQPLVPIESETLPSEPVQMLLPLTGSLRISTRDESGQRVPPESLRLKLTAYATPERTTALPFHGIGSTPELDPSGVTIVPYLGLGLYLRIVATARDESSRRRPLTVDIDGPVRDGQEVHADMLWSSVASAETQYPRVTGRFVFSDGRAWPDAASIRVRQVLFPHPEVYPGQQTLSLDAQGRFTLMVKQDCPIGGRRTLHFECLTPSEHAGTEAKADLSRTLPAGTTDLGDIPLDRGPLLCAGIVTDASGNPLPEARLSVSQAVKSGDRVMWPRFPCSGRSSLKADGSFSLHQLDGRAQPAGPLRLRVTCSGFVNSEELEFVPGAAGLRIVLEQSGGIAGAFRLGPDLQAKSIALRVESGSRTDYRSLRSDGSFEIRGLSVGPARLVAYLRSAAPAQRKASRIVIDNIVVLGGEVTRDPRCADIRLAGSIPGLSVTVRNGSGFPIQRAGIQVLGHRSILTDRNGVASFHPDVLPVRVRITAFGYRDVEIVDLASSREVALEPGLSIKLSTEARPIGKSPAYHLGFFLYHVSSSGKRSRLVYGASYPVKSRFFDEHGSARVPVPGPGVYIVEPYVYVSSKDKVGRSGRPEMPHEHRITVLESEQTQSYRVPISQSRLDALVKKLEH